ncbi:Rep [Pusillimonas sp. T7-7]|nr:Rep [Pusillimonas sp. T7-7]
MIRNTARAAQQKQNAALAKTCPLSTAYILDGLALPEAAEAVSAPSTLRRAPDGDEQQDFFIPSMWDVSAKDSRSLMDVAVFRLSKRDKRAGQTIRYELTDGYVEVTAGPSGMASIWDYDIMLMAISYLTEAMNRHRDGFGDKPTRTVRPSVVDILKFCRRSDGGRQYEEIEHALDRLKNTTLKIVRTRQGRSGRVMREVTGEGLLSNYRVLSYAGNGKVASVEIEVPQWIYHEIVETTQPEVLTVHADYFLIEPGIGRFLYRLARRVAGRGRARWSFSLIYKRSGSAGSFKEFCRMLRRLIDASDLPEYVLTEEAGKSGPMLVITNRDAKPGQYKVGIDDGQDDDSDDAV